MDHVHSNPLDSAKLDALISRAVGDLSAGYGGVMVSLGNRLGLYKAMAEAGPLNSRELASRAGCAERYVREWLGSQVAGGYVDYHAISDTYELTQEQALVLANEDSPVFIPSAWAVPASMWADEDKAVEAFRTGKGIPWGDHDGRLACGVAAFYRNAYRGSLVPEWLPALDGVVEKLEAGAFVADVGCGHGHSTVLMAKAFPASRFRGFDTHPESLVEARRVAAEAGVEQDDLRHGAGGRVPRHGLRPDLLLRLPARHGRSGRGGGARGQGDCTRRHGGAGGTLRQ